jgi:psp operon transcriptional activator
MAPLAGKAVATAGGGPSWERLWVWLEMPDLVKYANSWFFCAKFFASGCLSMRVEEAIGRSETFLAFTERLSRAAAVDRPVMLIGERGTGKELAAAKLHYLSRRWEGPLVALNCAALAPALVEAELFGHEQGAFTGATRERAGRFEAADGGTLLLDEIGLVPLEAQEKLLRVVEYGTFERVGSSRPKRVDVRIVAATNADLPALARAGRFKEDLLDRLAFEVLHVPPLRDRREDIFLLAGHFAARIARELGGDAAPEFTAEARARLESHPWPGNIRELKNVVERAVHRADGEPIGDKAIDFDPFRRPGELPPATALTAGPAAVDPPKVTTRSPLPASLPAAIAALEVESLRGALRATRHHQRKAATLLGLSYHQFRGLYRKHAASLEE